MLAYTDIDPHKKAFIFELDNVLYPEKDYLLQVYYLFASFIEYVETVPAAGELIAFMKKVYENHGAQRIFDKASEVFGIDEKYRENFERLHHTAKLPLKLLLFSQILPLLQDMVVDRKQVFIITNGDPKQQLNKTKQIEWHGLDEYLVIYFAKETVLKPDTATLEHIMGKYNLIRRDLLIIGASHIDQEFAQAAGVDYLDVGLLE
ncbi:MAG TPA: HAD hydrolase-like protein [Sphingobacteriaceae bacterium]|nr:HAD hydrolase-like protein [Sphingobacteriaceae bacterium]